MRKSRQIRIQLVHQLTMAHCAARIDLIRRKWRICCVLPQQDTMVGSRNNGWRCRDTSRRKVIVAMAQHRGDKASTSVRQSPIRSLLLAPSVRLPPPEWGRRGWKRKGMAVQPITTKKNWWRSFPFAYLRHAVSCDMGPKQRKSAKMISQFVVDPMAQPKVIDIKLKIKRLVSRKSVIIMLLHGWHSWKGLGVILCFCI
jgi:hypothetical protein